MLHTTLCILWHQWASEVVAVQQKEHNAYMMVHYCIMNERGVAGWGVLNVVFIIVYYHQRCVTAMRSYNDACQQEGGGCCATESTKL